MTTATTGRITAACGSNTVTTLTVPNHFTTPAMATQARREVARVLPRGWLRVRHIRDHVDGATQDHIGLDAVAGPPTGSFEIWRTAGLFQVYHWHAGGYADDVALLGAFPTLRGAVGTVRQSIDDTLTGWGLPPLAVVADGRKPSPVAVPVVA